MLQLDIGARRTVTMFVSWSESSILILFLSLAGVTWVWSSSNQAAKEVNPFSKPSGITQMLSCAAL